jgi:hypothetical protein
MQIPFWQVTASSPGNTNKVPNPTLISGKIGIEHSGHNTPGTILSRLDAEAAGAGKGVVFDRGFSTRRGRTRH